MATAQDANAKKIPVTLVTGHRLAAIDGETAFVRLPANTGHGHADGDHCIACAGRGDVRTVLFELLEEMRQGLRPAFSRVVLDVSDLPDSANVIAAIKGELPAQAYRDHTVARRFYLAGAA